MLPLGSGCGERARAKNCAGYGTNFQKTAAGNQMSLQGRSRHYRRRSLVFALFAILRVLRGSKLLTAKAAKPSQGSPRKPRRGYRLVASGFPLQIEIGN